MFSPKSRFGHCVFQTFAEARMIGPPKNQQNHGKSRFYYKNGLQDLFVQIDMVLTFHFRQGLPRKCLYKSPKDISWEVPEENER